MLQPLQSLCRVQAFGVGSVQLEAAVRPPNPGARAPCGEAAMLAMGAQRRVCRAQPSASLPPLPRLLDLRSHLLFPRTPQPLAPCPLATPSPECSSAPAHGVLMDTPEGPELPGREELAGVPAGQAQTHCPGGSHPPLLSWWARRHQEAREAGGLGPWGHCQSQGGSRSCCPSLEKGGLMSLPPGGHWPW